MILALLAFGAAALANPPSTPPAGPATSDGDTRVRRPLDYTAWSMAQGEVRVGLTRVDVGVLPRVMAGTQTGLDLLGIYNVGAQWSVIDREGVGLALGGAFHDMPVGDFHARHSRVDLTASRQLDRMGLHGSLGWTRLSMGGNPDPGKLSPVLLGLLGLSREEVEADTGEDAAQEEPTDLDARLDTIRARAAVDLRLSEHHALVGQLGMALAQSKRLGEEIVGAGQGLPDDLGLARTLDPQATAGPGESYVASLAWQGSWAHWQVRAGLGLSADPYAWLLQSTELSWRFGGRARQVEVPVADGGGEPQGEG